MQKDDLVYVGHMLDTAEQAIRKVAGKERADFDIVWDVETAELPSLAGKLRRLLPPE
jgi:uncharacterized protein with HEPN domain